MDWKKKNRIGRKVLGLPLLMALILLATAAVGGTLAYVIAKAGPVRNLFVSGFPPVGSLAIHKTVEHPFGEDYAIPDNDNTTFTFTVDLGADNAEKTFGDYTADSEGKVELTVKAGATVSLTDIPAGTTVTVSEHSGKSGFAVQADQSVAIVRDSVQTVNFVNPYTPAAAPARLSVTGVKELVGREWKEDDTFTFRLEQSVGGGWVNLGERTITAEFALDPVDEIEKLVPESVCFDFSDLVNGVSFNKAGVYSFRITEVEGSIAGVTYDKTESRFEITVGDADMDGYLEIQSITPLTANTVRDGNKLHVTFENQYAPVGSTEAFIRISKTLDDRSGQSLLPSGYVFALYEAHEAGHAYKIEDAVMASEPTDALGQTEFRLVIEPEQAGQVYEYVLKERDDGAPGMTYDDQEIHVYIAVSDNGDGSISAYVYDDEQLEDYLASLPAEDGLTDDPGGSETVEEPASELPEQPEQADNDTEAEPQNEPVQDEEPAQNDETVQNEEPAQDEEPVTDGAAEYMTEAAVTDEASWAAPALDGEEEAAGEDGGDDFEEAPQETEPEAPQEAEQSPSQAKAPAESTVEYETAPTTDSAAASSASRIPPAATNEYEAEFENIYDPNDATVALTGEKELSGRDQRAEEFSFSLYATGDDFAVAGDAGPVAEASNAEDGSFRFADLKFDAVGTYYYAAMEQPGSAKGVSYDETRFLITVSVTDGGGALTAAVTITDDLGQPGDIVFKNTYAPGMTSVVWEGTKLLSGMTLGEGDFSFALYETDSDFTVNSTAVSSVYNLEDGSFRFGEVKFYEPGTSYFVVRENRSAPMAGVSYDDTEYRITVTAEDDGDGDLITHSRIEAARGGNIWDTDSIRFRNAYSASYATLTVTGTKTLSGGELRDGLFRFDLYEVDEEGERGDTPLYTAEVTADGGFTFPTMTFANAGTYLYSVVEDASNPVEGMTYDETVYDVKVTVTDDGEGLLNAVMELTADGEAVEAIVFENTYEAPAETPEPTPTSTPKPGGGGGDVRTGDGTDLTLWVVVLLVSMTGVVTVVIVLRKTRRKER